MGFATPTLRLTHRQHMEIIGHCYDGLPDEACGLLGGPLNHSTWEPTGQVDTVYRCVNADASARTYTVDSRDLIKAMRDAEAKGGGLIGVFHSHTHTDAYPSDTDVRQAADPTWIYVLVSLKSGGDPTLRAYRIVDGSIAEVSVTIDD